MNLRRTLAAVTAVALLSSCSGPGSWFGLRKPHNPDADITVAAALFPLAEVVAQVGGAHVEVLNLTPDGRDAHETELTAKQLASLEESAAVFYIGGDFQPSIEKAVASLKKPVTVDVLTRVRTQKIDAAVTGPTIGGGSTVVDPHVWMDPANMVAIARNVQDVLTTALPAFTAEFTTNTDRYVAELDAVGTLIDDTFLPVPGRAIRCTHSSLVVAHNAIGYLLSRARLAMVPITGVNPDEQVTARRIDDLVAAIRANGDRYVIAETLVPGDLAHAVADRAGVEVATVNPLEGMSTSDIKHGENYISVMRANIATLASAYGCK